MRVLIVEDEPYMADAIRDGLRLEAIAADVAGDGNTALELLRVNAYDIAVLDRDIPRPSGDEIARQIVASGSGLPTSANRAGDQSQATKAEERQARRFRYLDVFSVDAPSDEGVALVRDVRVFDRERPVPLE